MKENDPIFLLAFAAHPDDLEFGCGGVIALETRAGRQAHLVICSRGESASKGTPDQRVIESENSARILGATLQFIELDGDAHLEPRIQHAITLAGLVRQFRPEIVLAPTLVENQHPDHPRLGRLVRDACRLARYGGLKELMPLAPHLIGQLYFYAQGPESEPPDITPLLIDVSDPQILATWKEAMEAHASQTASREYVELQLTRARLNGLRAGIGHAIPLFPNDPLVIPSLSLITGSARRF